MGIHTKSSQSSPDTTRARRRLPQCAQRLYTAAVQLNCPHHRLGAQPHAMALSRLPHCSTAQQCNPMCWSTWLRSFCYSTVSYIHQIKHDTHPAASRVPLARSSGTAASLAAVHCIRILCGPLTRPGSAPNGQCLLHLTHLLRRAIGSDWGQCAREGDNMHIRYIILAVHAEDCSSNRLVR